MFANLVILAGDPVRSPAVPSTASYAKVTTDRHRFIGRTVKIGLERDGYRQILEGLQPSELVAADGAIFLSNMLATARPE